MQAAGRVGMPACGCVIHMRCVAAWLRGCVAAWLRCGAVRCMRAVRAVRAVRAGMPTSRQAGGRACGLAGSLARWLAGSLARWVGGCLRACGLARVGGWLAGWLAGFGWLVGWVLPCVRAERWTGSRICEGDRDLIEHSVHRHRRRMGRGRVDSGRAWLRGPG